ncbi:hypothetical protein Tco_0890226 [Tanacetum coccineum]|uniref:Uncharacterized protein n=1 Tax=Tanacetum coccineum TaxID=301880 RepID=A0ABQ5C5D8_9ASTR
MTRSLSVPDSSPALCGLILPSINDNTNVVNAPREPSVVDQDPGVNISQDPPQIDHNCCYECGDSLNGIFCQQCICEFCGKGAHFGYNCPPKDPIISELEPCYNRNFDCFPHDSQTLPQQYFCCENCGGPHETYQCQPMNQEYFYSHSSGFDQFQPPQFSDVYQTPPVASMEMLHAQTDLIESMQNFLKKYDHIPHNEKSIKLLLAEEKFLKIKQVVEEEQTQPEYLQELLQSLLTDLQILNEIQPLKQETSNQIQKDQEEKNIAELLAEERFQKANQALNESQSSQEMRIQDLEIQKQQCLEEMKEWMNDLGIREYQKEEIDIDYRRKCEDKIYELKDKFNSLSIEIRKITQEAKELRESEARARSQKIIIDDDDDNLGFYAVHPNTIHIPVSQNVEPKDSLIMGDGWPFTLFRERRRNIVETLVSNSRLAHLLHFLGNALKFVSKTDDTDGRCRFDDDFYDLNLSYRVLRENDVLDEEEDTFTFTTRSFLPFVTYPEDKSSKELAPSKALLNLDVFDPLHPPLMDFHDTKAFSGFTFSLLKIFSKQFFEPGIKNAKERILIRTKEAKKTVKTKRNGKMSRARSEETCKDQALEISKTQQERKSKPKIMKPRTENDKSSKFKNSFGVIKIKGLRLHKRKVVYKRRKWKLQTQGPNMSKLKPLLH